MTMNMRNGFMAALIVALAITVSACSSIEKLTGMGRDDTVLPGTREDAIPGKPSFPDPNDQLKPGGTTGDNATQQGAAAQNSAAPTQSTLEPAPAPTAPCKPTDQKCKLAAKKAAAAAAQQSSDVFSDPQQ